MSQFDNWPADDLRLYKQEFESGKSSWLVYSVQMDALTPVKEQDLEQLRQRGIQEINELPDSIT